MAKPSSAPLADPCVLTPPEVAKRLRVNPSKVIGWIRRGELVAVDISLRPGIGRPRYRIHVDALAAFERQRAITPNIAPQAGEVSL